MGLFKNEVGRPSNETIKKRNIFKGICVLLVIVIIGLVGYILNDKGVFGTNSTKKTDNNQNITTTTNQIKEVYETFDTSKVTTKKAHDAIDVYVYGKKLDIDSIFSINEIKVIEDIAIIDLERYANQVNDIVIVNTKGELLFFSYNENNMNLCKKSSYANECYGYNITDNKIKLTLSKIPADITYGMCVDNNNKDVIVEYDLTYEEGKINKIKKMSLNGNDYVKKYNIDCSSVN